MLNARGWVTALMCALCSMQAPAVEVALDSAELRAELSPRRFAMLSAEMSGKIAQMPIFEGQVINKGDLMVAFDCAIQEAQRQKAQAELAVAKNNRVGSERMAELNAIGAVELTNAQLEEQKARADIAYLNATLERCRIYAPYKGSVGDVAAREQEFVQAGAPLVEVIDDSELQLEFIAPSRWLVWLKPGFSFNVYIEDTSNNYPARVERVAAKVDALSQSIKVTAIVDGDFPELLPGMSGRIRISADAAVNE